MKWTVFFLLLFPSFTGNTQHAVSIDVAGLHNTSYKLSGLNVSCFYHFSKRVAGGIELNRFFPKQQLKSNEEVQLSAWDTDINFHYFFFPEHNWKVYAAAGITHTSDKEELVKDGQCTYEHFWSLNTGAGILYKWGNGHRM